MDVDKLESTLICIVQNNNMISDKFKIGDLLYDTQDGDVGIIVNITTTGRIHIYWAIYGWHAVHTSFGFFIIDSEPKPRDSEKTRYYAWIPI